MEPNQSEKMLFALLRSALRTAPGNSALFADVSPSVWQECYKLAAQQGVMALAWDGIIALPPDLQPPKPLKLTWALAVEKYGKRYRRYCRTVTELSRYYAEHGIVTVQMKGVGLSAYYPPSVSAGRRGYRYLHLFFGPFAVE